MCPTPGESWPSSQYSELRSYWVEIITALNNIFCINLPVDSTTYVLGHFDIFPVDDNLLIAITRSLFSVHKVIAQKWTSTCPPLINDWISELNIYPMKNILIIWEILHVYLLLSDQDGLIWCAYLPWKEWWSTMISICYLQAVYYHMFIA